MRTQIPRPNLRQKKLGRRAGGHGYDFRWRRSGSQLWSIATTSILWNGSVAGPHDAPEKRNKGNSTMTELGQVLRDEVPSTELTRFNALRHGVLSRYTVLPWENADEYHAIVAALVAEHAPQGPTEEHLVEEIAGIMWRKRRLRLAEAAAHRQGLEETLESYRETVKVALVHLGATAADTQEDMADIDERDERVVDAIRATAADTQEDMADMAADEAMTHRALELLGSKRNDAYEAGLAAYEAGLAALREDI